MKLYAFLIGTICSCLSVFGLSNTTIAQTNEQATAPAEQKKTIQVPVYTKDDVMLNNGLFLKKSDKNLHSSQKCSNFAPSLRIWEKYFENLGNSI